MVRNWETNETFNNKKIECKSYLLFLSRILRLKIRKKFTQMSYDQNYYHAFFQII